ncbi:MAG: glycosyltransferase [Microbacteriaceae bacterium]|nr:glycosyltransferase [Microbacteriaceae bacterium]
MSIDAGWALPYRHLARLTTLRGVYEHARHDAPRAEHGYCTDDIARALVVAIREPAPAPELEQLAQTCLGYLDFAVVPGGRVRNRMSRTGRWTDAAAIGDWWGRAIAALGFTAVNARRAEDRQRARLAFLRAAERRSPDVRASAFAALGAAELVRAHPELSAARQLLDASLAVIPLAPGARWDWPEPRLRYANATLCEALIAGGNALDRPELVDRGLELLAFLLRTETATDGRLSVTGSAGWAPGERGPLWDQQPIEVAAIADACVRAFEVTGAPVWRDGVRLAWNWFLGANDSNTPMVDLRTGAGYDGLEPGGRNSNRGAESTLAALSTHQRLRELGLAAAG